MVLRRGGDVRGERHTLDAIREALDARSVAAPVTSSEVPLSAFGWFVGYLALDALVGNTDRHHENWAVLATGSGAGRTHRLAPSYDHASCLGRELSDEDRSRRLGTKDSRQQPAAYAARAKSAFYATADARKPLSCADAFREACKLDAAAGTYWKHVVTTLDEKALLETILRVPDVCITSPARRFATAVLDHNAKALKGPCS